MHDNQLPSTSMLNQPTGNGILSQTASELAHNLSKLAADVRNTRGRLQRLNSLLSGNPMKDRSPAGPEAGPMGLMQNLSESYSNISSDLSHVTDEIDKFERTLGLDSPTPSR